MATLWCPQCGDEYREGFAECADCGVALVATKPGEPAPPEPAPELHGPFRAEDDPVELVNVSAVEAEMIAGQLRGAGIMAQVNNVGTAGQLLAVQFTQGSRVMVRRADLAAAQRAMDDVSGIDDASAPVDQADLAAQAEAARDWSDPGSGTVV
jgi:hypothetical protein